MSFDVHGLCMPESMTVESINQLDRCTECGDCEGSFVCTGADSNSHCARICHASYIEENTDTPTGEDCELSFLGDGWCDPVNNTESCGWDLGDCCESTCVDADYQCGVQTAYDCQDPSAEDYGTSGGSGGDICNWYALGDGACNTANNTEACSWDYGDCCASTCSSTSFDCGSSGYICADPNASENGGTLYGIADEYEPNDSLQDSTVLVGDSPQTHSIHGTNPDYLTFILDAPADVTVIISSNTSVPNCYFTDAQGNQVNYLSSWSDLGQEFEARPLEAGQYYLELNHWDWQGLPSYTVKLLLSSPSANPPTGVTAHAISSEHVEVSWDSSDELERYRVYWGYYPNYPITDPASGETALAPGETHETSYTITGLTPGSYYDIWVTGLDENDQETAPSSPSSVEVPISPDAFEPDNTPETATPINLGEVHEHSIHTGGDEDFTRFELTQETSIRIHTSGIQGDTEMTLFDANQNQLYYNDNYFNQMSQIDAYGLPAGTYFIRVHSYGYYSMIGSYQLSVEVMDPNSGPVDPSLLPDSYCDDGMFCVPPLPDVTSNIEGMCALGTSFNGVFCQDNSVCQSGETCMLFPDNYGFCITACESSISADACEDAEGSVILVGDGYCHPMNNKEACGYDGGDCCESTCRGAYCSQATLDCQDPNAP